MVTDTKSPGALVIRQQHTDVELIYQGRNNGCEGGSISTRPIR